MTIRFTQFSLVLFLMFATGMLFGQSSEQNEDLNASIVESVFRYQMTKCSENAAVELVFFLSDRGKEPTDKFMRRFVGEKARVKKRSSMGSSASTNEFIDKESGKYAVLLSVDKLKAVDEDKAEVEGSCGFASWAARGYKYDLVKEEKGWIVKRAEPTWVW